MTYSSSTTWIKYKDIDVYDCSQCDATFFIEKATNEVIDWIFFFKHKNDTFYVSWEQSKKETVISSINNFSRIVLPCKTTMTPQNIKNRIDTIITFS